MNFETIQRLVTLTETSELGQIEVMDGTQRIKVVNTIKTSIATTPKTTISPVALLDDGGNNADELVVIRATAVGKFCLDGISLKSGDAISVGDTIGGVLALGVLTPIKADESGTLHEYLVKGGDKVEWGQGVVMLD